MMRKSLVRLSLSLMFLAGAVATAPSAEAACENQRTRITTYWAYVDTSNPSKYWCTEPLVGPPCPTCWNWQAIGGVTSSDCEGNSSWGDTTKCTGPANTTYDSYICGVICDT